MVALAIMGWSAALGCDRNLEPFDPNEEPSQPDLARIFPETQQQGPGLRGPRPPGESVESPAGRRGTAPVVSAGTADVPSPIRGRIDVAPELANDVRSDSVLFLIARSGAGGGPPLAVRRFSAPRFPLEFEIGQENVMIPSMRFEGAIQLTARLDSDGNAMTRLAGDLQGAMPTPLSPGAEGALLTLDQKL
jgi:cytochrome c-type biogenesis protein CcmH